MIYLIKHDAIVGGRILHLLKIGYTSDNGFNKRISQYRIHNPTFTLLLTVSGCDDKVEKALHRYFREYRYNGYGREWFDYNQEIIDFFKKYNTKELLEDKLQHLLNYVSLSPLDIIDFYNNIKLAVNRWLCLVSNDKDSLIESSNKIKQIIVDCKRAINKQILFKEDIVNYLKTKYNISEDIEKDLLDYISGNIKNSEEVNQFLIDFNNKKSFGERLKLLCTSKLTEDEKNNILNQLPLYYKRYYKTLDLGTLCPFTTDVSINTVEKECQATFFNKDDLKSEIYLSYQVGQTYTEKDLKISLQQLYNKINYTKEAKAIDIKEYFEVKEYKALNKDSGKSERYYELVNKVINKDVEEWRQIYEYEDYEVSNLGNVRNKKTGRILRATLTKDGYPHLSLSSCDKRKFFNVHQLVAMAFIPNPSNLPEITHLDRNKLNNRVDNLIWCNHEKISVLGSRDKRKIKKKKKITEQYSKKDGKLITTYKSTNEASEKTGISYGGIRNCCNGKQKSAGGFIWKFKN